MFFLDVFVCVCVCDGMKFALLQKWLPRASFFCICLCVCVCVCVSICVMHLCVNLSIFALGAFCVCVYLYIFVYAFVFGIQFIVFFKFYVRISV